MVGIVLVVGGTIPLELVSERDDGL